MIMAINADAVKKQAEYYEKLILNQIGVFINTKPIANPILNPNINCFIYIFSCVV